MFEISRRLLTVKDCMQSEKTEIYLIGHSPNGAFQGQRECKFQIRCDIYIKEHSIKKAKNGKRILNERR